MPSEMNFIEVVSSRNSDEWMTPREIYELAQEWWGPHDLDAAADKYNSFCWDFFSKDDSALDPESIWGSNNWCNPPFSLADEFVDRAIKEATENHKSTTLLLKAAVETNRFKMLRAHGVTVVFLAPRVHYLGAGKSCPFPSMLVRVTPIPELSRGTHWYNFRTKEWY